MTTATPMPSGSHDYGVLVSTFSRVVRYAPLVQTTADRLWLDRPEFYLLTDGGLEPGPRTLVHPGLNWVELLRRGLVDLKARVPGVRYVFHLLEDHCPLRACDTRALNAYFDLARRHDIMSISFPTYGWPWDETEQVDYPDGLVRTWRRIDIRTFDDRRLAVVPRDFFRYFGVQPTFWNIDYLIEACDVALARGLTDAWAFEAMRWEDAAQHYVAAYDWPTVHHGFLAAGAINPAAIAFMDRRGAGELRAQLIRESIGVDNIVLYRLWRAYHRVKAALARRLPLANRGAP